MMWAARAGRADIVSRLLDGGADPDMQDDVKKKKNKKKKCCKN